MKVEDAYSLLSRQQASCPQTFSVFDESDSVVVEVGDEVGGGHSPVLSGYIKTEENFLTDPAPHPSPKELQCLLWVNRVSFCFPHAIFACSGVQASKISRSE